MVPRGTVRSSSSTTQRSSNSLPASSNVIAQSCIVFPSRRQSDVGPVPEQGQRETVFSAGPPPAGSGGRRRGWHVGGRRGDRWRGDWRLVGRAAVQGDQLLVAHEDQ